MTAKRFVELNEYQTQYFPPNFFNEDFGKLVWRRYRNFIEVTPPSWKNDYQWELRPGGWVGYIPVTDETTLKLQPKVPIANLFHMLEVAYRLNFEVIHGLYDSQSLEEFYETLAKILALKVLDRKKKGLYRKYINVSEELPFVRGRLQLQEIYRKPWQVKMPIQYQDHTPDISDNQVLAWTMFVIIRSGICSENSISSVRKAYRELQRLVQLNPYTPKDCINRLYDRLNYDYEPMHAICRFFLENTGPTINLGDHTMMPFLIDMAKLFELFVAEWLRTNLPPPYQLKDQDRISLGPNGEIIFIIDLVIINNDTGEVIYVLDTKYKVPDSISSQDIAQIVAYAEAKDSKDGVIIYPAEIKSPIKATVGEINVRTLPFRIDGNLDQAGTNLIEELTLP